jgi:CheY-like chemotaxis protein
VSDQVIRAQILHVDDDAEVLEGVKEYLEGEDIDGWGRPQVIGIASFDEALRTLEERRIDLVILDVRLGGHEEQDLAAADEEGVRTLAEIRNRRFVPVVFWTGLPSKVADLAGPLVRVGDKTADTVVELGERVRALFATGLPNVNRALRHLVEDEQRRYMWEFVAEHWDEFQQDGDHTGLAYLLVRRLGRSMSGPGIQRVAAELGGGGPRAPAAGAIQAAEMYVVPPLPDTRPGVAEIMREQVEGDPRWWFVLTPSCDLEHPEKLARVIMAECLPADKDSRILDWIAEDSGSKRSRVRDLVSHKTGGQDDRWLYLPPAPTIPHLVVDLQRLRSATVDEFNALERVGSLISPFAEAAVNRFGRYYGRVGTDDLDVATLMQLLKSDSL